MKKESEAGQATVEFALTTVLLFAFILFFIQLSLVFAWGNYVHYATFMAARALQAAGPSQDDQVERAKEYIFQMLKRGQGSNQDRFKVIARGVGDGDPKGLEIEVERADQNTVYDSSWEEGIRYKFESRVFLIPMGRAKAGPPGTSVNSVTLTSESLLGREPSYSECQEYMSQHDGIIDNGC